MDEVSRPKRVLLVGHCGPDANYLRMAVRSALGQAEIVSAEEMDAMTESIKSGVDLVLFNRELGYGFEPDTGVEMIRLQKQSHAELAMILVSNYAEAQAAAVAAGALPGFGKREMGSPRVATLLRSAIGINS
jgi:two-component system, chemotaxis family, chemotaxis protein CheY